MDLKKKVTILVNSCDKYSDLWTPFFTLLYKYWPGCDLEILLNTETKNYRFNGLNIDRCPTQFGAETSYGLRMITTVSNIKTDYLLLLLDDFFIRRLVDVEKLKDIIGWMDCDDNIACFNFAANNDNSVNDEKYDGYVLMNQKCAYKLNLQAAIWRTEKFLSYWSVEDDPWKWELFVNFTTFDMNDKFYTISDKTNAPIYYGYNDLGMGVYRGKWVYQDVKPLFEKNGLEIDYEKRGVYNPDTDKAKYHANFKLLNYSLRRIGIKYTVMILLFEIYKIIYKLFGKTIQYNNLPQYLNRKNKR